MALVGLHNDHREKEKRAEKGGGKSFSRHCSREMDKEKGAGCGVRGSNGIKIREKRRIHWHSLVTLKITKSGTGPVTEGGKGVFPKKNPDTGFLGSKELMKND